LWNYATVVNLIGATRGKAILDTNEYETGIEVSLEQMAGLAIRRHEKYPDWSLHLSEARDGDQLWAEAKPRFDASAPWWLESRLRLPRLHQNLQNRGHLQRSRMGLPTATLSGFIRVS
jgi:hypothetical protein